jgi:hypothetical protein
MSIINRNARNVRTNARAGTPIAMPANVATVINTESDPPTREEYQLLLETVARLTETVGDLTRKVARLEQDTANHERSLTLINFEDDETLDSQPVIPPSRRTGGLTSAVAVQEDTSDNRGLLRVNTYINGFRSIMFA